MMLDLKKLAASALALSLLAAPAMAQEWYGEWDGNEDGALDQEEFTTGFGEAGVYESWDGDGDGALSEDEFNQGVFGGYDADDSGTLEEPELQDAGDDMGDGGLFDI